MGKYPIIDGEIVTDPAIIARIEKRRYEAEELNECNTPTFEEQFPSIPQSDFRLDDGTIIRYACDIRTIQQYCLDKQKVREAWHRYLSMQITEEDFEKELGL